MHVSTLSTSDANLDAEEVLDLQPQGRGQAAFIEFQVDACPKVEPRLLERPEVVLKRTLQQCVLSGTRTMHVWLKLIVTLQPAPGCSCSHLDRAHSSPKIWLSLQQRLAWRIKKAFPLAPQVLLSCMTIQSASPPEAIRHSKVDVPHHLEPCACSDDADHW